MKRKAAKLLRCVFYCPHCKREVSVEYADGNHGDVEFTGHEYECDLCGSHGEVKVEFTCPVCKKTFEDIELESW